MGTTRQFQDLPRSRGLQTLLARQGDDLAVSRHAQVPRPPDPLGEARRRLGSFKTCPGPAASRPSWRGKETTWQFQDMPRSRGLQTLLARQGGNLAVSRHAQVTQPPDPLGEARRQLGSFKTCPGHAASRPSWRGKEATWQFQDM